MNNPAQEADHKRRSPIRQWLHEHRARISLVLRVLTAVILMGIVLSLLGGNWDEFIDVDWRLIAVAYGLVMLSTVVKALRWSLLVRQSRMDVSFLHLLGTYLVGAFFSTVLPTSVGGDAVRAVDTANHTGRPADATLSVLIERGIGLLVVVGSGSIFALFLEPGKVPTIFLMVVHLMFVGGMVGLVLLWRGWFMDPIAATLTRLHLYKWERKVRQMQGVLSGHLGRPGVLFSIFLLSMVAHALTIAATYIVLDAVTDPIPLVAFVPVIALTTVAELLPISVAAVGVKESAYVFFLGLVNVGSTNATVVALIMRGLTLARALVGGVVFFVRQSRRKEKQEGSPPPPNRPASARRVEGEHPPSLEQLEMATAGDFLPDEWPVQLPTP